MEVCFNFFWDITKKQNCWVIGHIAWKTPWTEEPGRLQSMESLRVWHNWATSLSLFTFMHWRKWQPTPVLLPGKFHGQRSLIGYSPWGCKESDMTEGIHFLSFCFIDYTTAFDCMDHNKLWKILQEMGIPDHLTCLLRNLYAGQE